MNNNLIYPANNMNNNLIYPPNNLIYTANNLTYLAPYNLPIIMITRPKKINDASEYTYKWAEVAINMARNMGYPVLDVKMDDVNYENVNNLIDTYHPGLFVHYGHGCPSSLQGQKECALTKKIGVKEMMMMSPCEMKSLLQPLRMGCSDNQRISKLSNDICFPLCSYETNINKLGYGAIVYAVACHSLKQLGRSAIKYGVPSYIGFDDLLLFPTDSMKTEIMFGEIQNLFLQKLLEGYSVGEANDITNYVEDKYIRFFKTTKYVGLPLLWNMKHRMILGNPYAKLI